MPSDSTRGPVNRQNLEEFRAQQEEMLSLGREYSRARLALWAEEARNLAESWAASSREWQETLEQMSAFSAEKFAEITARGEAASNLLSQNMREALTQISGEVDTWGEHFLGVMEKVAVAWENAFSGGGGAGGGWPGWLGNILGFGGWFHQGGIVEAHQGLVISPETLLGDEQLVLAQAGEGILPRESIDRLGEKNFEALRTGRFEVAPGTGAPRYDITIQVQTLDAAGAASLDWSRVVQRHLLPLLQNDAARRW